VAFEAVLAALLVGLMILLFLGSWRNTIVVITSIPCAMFAGIICLYLTGHSINLMTLGGLALATGILVDDATVAVENIHRNRALGKPLTVAILDGSHEVALPRTMATLAICIVFIPYLPVRRLNLFTARARGGVRRWRPHPSFIRAVSPLRWRPGYAHRCTRPAPTAFNYGRERCSIGCAYLRAVLAVRAAPALRDRRPRRAAAGSFQVVGPTSSGPTSAS
jgi:hypothetical protein